MNEIKKYDPEVLDFRSWRPHMCQFFREAVLRISRPELGKIMNVAAATIASWEDPENGVAPSRKNLENLCRVFECEPFELYTDFDPKQTRAFLNDVFRTWSFVLQKAIRSSNVSEQKFALNLTELFMDYDERRRSWEAAEPDDEKSEIVESELDEIMFGKNPEGTPDSNDDPNIEEGSEEDADEEEEVVVHAVTSSME